jgi:anti-anti-sigma factor
MEITENRHGAVTVVKPAGPLVGPEGERLKAHLTDVMARSLGRFVVDASAIPLVDSRGLEVLAEAAQDLGESGQTLRLCGAGETLREVLELTDLAGLFEHYADVNTAVRSFL